MNIDRRKVEKSKKYSRRAACAVLTLVALALFTLFWYLKFNPLMLTPFLLKGNYIVLIVYVVLFMSLQNLFGGYKLIINRISMSVISQVIALFFINVITFVIVMLMIGKWQRTPQLLFWFFIMSVVQVVAILLVTVAATKLYRKKYPPYKMLSIHGDYDNNLVIKLNRRDDRYNVVDEISCEEDIAVLRERIKEFEAVILNDVPSKRRNEILKICFDESVAVYVTPKISDIMMKGSEDVNIIDTPLYLCDNLGMSDAQQFWKRFGDIVLALIGIGITSPVMLFTAIAIKRYDGGPVFYKQTRATIGGRPYEIMKFRSMITDAEADGRARLAQENDDRITPVGHFIRATRIDEIPQFFNILKGDMSFVGPRPERPEIIEKYCKEVPEFAFRTRVKAGLTGYAQVYGKYNTTSIDKLKLDLIYISKCSLLTDIQIILMTLKVIFIKESTEGVEEGKQDASVGTK